MKQRKNRGKSCIKFQISKFTIVVYVHDIMLCRNNNNDSKDEHDGEGCSNVTGD